MCMQYVIGCMSTCDDPPKNGSCSGTAGCCEAELPRGVRYYQGFFNELYNTTRIWRKAPCNYITVMESAAFNFSTTYLTSTAFYDADDSRTPVVMEWGITRQTCEEAKANETACACVSDHSGCVSSDAGYRCSCSKGFEGNPYIVHGCTGSFLLPRAHCFSAMISNDANFCVRFQILTSAWTVLLTPALEYAKIHSGISHVHAHEEET